MSLKDQLKNEKLSLEELKTVYPNIPEGDFTTLQRFYDGKTIEELNLALEGKTDIAKQTWLKNKYAFDLEYARGALIAISKKDKP